MKHFSLLTPMLLVYVCQVFAQTIDAPPTTPGSLSAVFYDNAGGEFFWERSTDDLGEVVGYEITINGENLGLRDALSFYDSTLLPDNIYVFSVVAIDNAGQRSTPAVTTLGNTGTIPEPPAYIEPEAPAELRSAIYSHTAAELFWRRESAAAAFSYEVRQDGTVVDTTDGISFFTTELSPGRDFLFEVIAIGQNGVRSSPSSIIVRTDHIPETPPTTLAAPSNLRAAVYSGTAAELFWNRATAPGLDYEIVRNGELLGSTDGTSFFDSALEDGVVYTYEVSAFSVTGRSQASTVTLQAGNTEPDPPTDNGNPYSEPDPAGTTVLARLGYPYARDLAVSIVRAEYLDFFFDVEDAVLALIESENGEEIMNQCPEGGTIQGSNIFPIAVVELDDCVVGGQVLSGNFELLRNRFPIAVGGVDQREYRFDELSVDAGEAGTFVVSGSYEISEAAGRSALCDAYQSGSDNVNISSALLALDGETYSISDATFNQSNVWRLFGPPFAQDLSQCNATRTLAFAGSATVSADSFGESVASIEINGETDSVTPAIVASFNDGSMLTVTAIPDAEDTVQVDLVSDGTAVSFVDNYRFKTRPDNLQNL